MITSQVERLAGGARFLGAVEDGDGVHGLGEGGDEGFDGEGPEEADFEEADLFAGGEHGFHGLVGHFGAGAHDDDDALGIGRAEVVEEMVLTAGDAGELVHRVLHDGRGGQVVGVAGFARLEVDVGILGGAADEGTVGGEAAGAVGEDQILVDHGAHVVGGKLLDLGDFVRGAEAIEEVHEGEARFEGGGLGDQRHIHDFLHGVRGEHAEPGGARAHHVAVVAEDGESLRGKGAGGDVEDRAGEFAGDLVHVGDHQQQTLRCREGGGERPRLQGSVQGAGGAAFALHLDDRRYGAPDVGLLLGRPLVGPFAHGGRRRNGINGDDFVGLVRYVRGRLVTVDSHLRASGGGG